MANYIREWNNMARCYNPFGCPFKAAHQGTTERRCTLEEDCVSKDKKATYNYVKKNEGYVVLNEKQRAEQAASMTGHELDQKIEAAKQLLNQLEELGKEFDLKETIKEVTNASTSTPMSETNARRLALGKNGEFNFKIRRTEHGRTKKIQVKQARRRTHPEANRGRNRQ